MQAPGRARSPNDAARLASRPLPPPLPARGVNGHAYGNTPPPEAIDPKWLEDAVLRILEKHGKGSLVDARGKVIAARTGRAPSRPRGRAWRVARAAIVLAALAGVSYFAARWRYPEKTASTLGAARMAIARIPPVTSWMASFTPSPHSVPVPSTFAPAIPAQPVLAPPPIAPVMVAPAMPSANASTAAPTTTPALPLAEATIPAPTPASKSDPKTESRHAIHAARATHRPSTAAPVADPVAAPVAAPLVPPVTRQAAAPMADAPPPIPGPLGEAIKRASGGRLTTPTSERLQAPDAKPSSDVALADRPAASLVNSALMAVLPDARACLSPGDDVTQAVVVFESSGAVSSVQVSGPAASCIQKALRNARLPPFAQATYRAGVPVRPR